MLRSTALALALLASACSTRDPKPTTERVPKAEAKAEAGTQRAAADERPPLVTLELGLVTPEALDQLRARLGPGSALAEAETLLAVRHEIADGWHIYWQNPGESGLRTRLTLAAEGVEPGPVLYPAPEQFVALGGQVSYGWEREAVLFVPLTQSTEAATIELKSDWLACHESCIPGQSEVEIPLAELPRRDDPGTQAMLDRIPEPAGDRLRTSWADGRLRVEPSAAEARIERFFPHAPQATGGAVLEATRLEDDALALDYRLDGPPPADAAQGVVRWTLAGETRWLELAVPWPAS